MLMLLRRASCALFPLALSVCFVSSASADCPPCGQMYCLNDPAFPAALAAKKQELRAQGYAERLIAMLDRVGRCIACIEFAPSAMHILLVYNETTSLEIEYTPALERGARESLRAGRIKEFHLVYAGKACACCGEKEGDERSDYDKRHDLNKSLAISYRSPSELGPDPEDLTRPSSKWRADRYEIPERPEPPKQRVAHPLCPACQPEADARNSAARMVDLSREELWRHQKQVDRARASARRASDAYQTLLSERSDRTRARLDTSALGPKLDAARAELENWQRAMRADREKTAALEKRLKDDLTKLSQRDAALLDCQRKKCTSSATTPTKSATPATPPTPDQPRTSMLPPLRANFALGPSFGASNTDTQLALALQIFVGLFFGGRGQLVFNPTFAVGGGSKLLLLSLAFQYDFALKMVALNLFAYARLGIGFGGQYFELGSQHGFLLRPEAGLYYLLGRRFLVGADLFSLPILAASLTTAISYQMLFYAGYRF